MLDQLKEEWKDVVDFEDFYEVSSIGRVKRKKGKTHYKDGRIAEFSEIILKSGLNSKGYPIVYLSTYSKQYTKPVHRLVAQAFIDNPENKKQVNHINCNKLDNSIQNLEWITNLENMRHAFINGVYTNRDLKNSNTGKKVINIYTNEIFDNIRIASEQIGIKRSTLQGYLSNFRVNKTDLRYYE